VRRKNIRVIKQIDPAKLNEYEEWRLEIKQRIKELKEQHYRIIYLDESIFTTKTITKKDYSPQHVYHQIPQVRLNQPVYALIFAISEEGGLEHYQIFEKSVTGAKFKQYLLNLRRANEFQRIAIFMDNLQVHKTKAVKKIMD